MTRRVKSLIAKKRITTIHEGDDIIITAPVGAPTPLTTLDCRCKVSGTLLFRQDRQGLSVKCNWCHEVQIITWEQVEQMWEQLEQGLSDGFIYCANCMQKGMNR